MGRFMVIKTSPIDGKDDTNEVIINLDMISSVSPAANGVLITFGNGSYKLDVSHGYNDYKKILEVM